MIFVENKLSDASYHFKLLLFVIRQSTLNFKKDVQFISNISYDITSNVLHFKLLNFLIKII